MTDNKDADSAGLVPATLAEIGAFHAAKGEHLVLRVGGTAVVYGFYMDNIDGRVWGSFSIAPGGEVYGTRIVRAVRRDLARRNQPVYVVCGTPEAGRVLRALGFAPIEEWAANKQVWKWRTR